MTDLARAEWFKSSFSNANNACVEVAVLPDAVAVRDSKDRGGPSLVFTPDQWSAFASAIRTDDMRG